MSHKWRLLIIVTAILLIPILTGMTPVNFVHKIGNGCPFAQGKQTLKCNPCPFNSVISQQDHGIVGLPSTLSVGTSIDLAGFEVLDAYTITSNSPLSVVPLRC
jgi:hypothetical protein